MACLPAALSTSPLTIELHAILALVMGFWTYSPLEFHVKEGQAPIRVTVWYINGSAKSSAGPMKVAPLDCSGCTDIMCLDG